MNYYNEWDKGAATWLRELIKAGLIPYGYVDERSITEVTPSDLEGFTQCHFFAGIGGWPLALQLAGIPASTRLWTGSPPCQPFSVAGQSLGFDDPRHLAPVFLRLIRECQPGHIFGEQVAAAIGKHWLDFVLLNLEDKGYSCGSAVLPAASVGAPHKRDRAFFGASMADGSGETCVFDLGYANDSGPQIWLRESGKLALPERREDEERLGGLSGVSGELADPEGIGREDGSEVYGRSYTVFPATTEVFGAGDRGTLDSANPDYGFWSGADWLGCRDGKFRPVESGTFPLANGIPSRVGRLRGYGNAIVPQVAAEFIKAFFGAEKDIKAKD